ncbi:MAG: GNAT family N-acetyltransferase [Negativicutes bacterium]|nr:GNAT family N-acetyltransferase [Negativicutes bacterium]
MATEYFMQSERIGFRHWRPEDLPLARRLWGDAAVTQWICASGRFSEAEISARLTKEIENQQIHQMQYWPIFLLKTEEFLGCCGLRPYAPEQGILEIGVHLVRRQWGKGLATEAARRVMTYAAEVLRAKALFAGHHPKNSGSQKVLQGLGFCYLKDEFYAPTGLLHPSYLFWIQKDS